MTDEELRDELVTLLLAGHETTATSVAWALERLVRHPHKLAPAGRRDRRPSDGGGEEYMTAVVNETLRVRPVVPIVVRMLTQELEVGGYRLPAGHAGGAVDLPHQPQSTRLRGPAGVPPRALPREDGPETFSWIPFGGGIRRCIGAVVRAARDEADPADDARRARTARRARRAPGAGRVDRRRVRSSCRRAASRVVWPAAGAPRSALVGEAPIGRPGRSEG